MTKRLVSPDGISNRVRAFSGRLLVGCLGYRRYVAQTHTDPLPPGR
jgi:hypothetical protein